MGLIEFFINLIGGIFGLVFGLIGGLIGLVFSIIGGIIGLVATVIGIALLAPLVVLYCCLSSYFKQIMKSAGFPRRFS